MSRLFFAVRSSYSFVLLISGVVSLRTYFLLAQPRVEAIANASMNVNEVRFIVKGLLLFRIFVGFKYVGSGPIFGSDLY